MKLQEWLVKNGITQQQAAKKLNISLGHCNGLCREKRYASLDLAYKIQKMTNDQVMSPEIMDIKACKYCPTCKRRVPHQSEIGLYEHEMDPKKKVASKKQKVIEKLKKRSYERCMINKE